ncbi:peptidoglycan-binding protein [Streptomyces sp. NPDC052301]|uniref:peptidoglycan-binding protein n=1 Tax=Streptomyces sp. NPDC052301 TaxID=3365687 RepID=UPI0037D1016F
MSDPKGHTCPECGAPRGADRTPSCDCTERASEALREARTAEAAAAEDFDPLRIRPYVGMQAPAPPADGVGTGGAGGSGTAETTGGDPGTADTAVGGPGTPHPVEVGSGTAETTGGGPGTADTAVGGPGTPHPVEVGSGTAETTGGGPGTADTAVGGPGTPHPVEVGSGGDVPHAGEPGGEEHGDREEERIRPRGRRTVLLSVAGAGVAVVVAAGVASGLFSYHTPTRNRAAQEVRQSVPSAAAPASTSPRPPVAPPRSPAPSAPPPTSAGPSPSATPSASPSPSPSGSAPRAPSPTPSPKTSTAPRTTPAAAPVLQRGDSGPEVRELQLRLRQLNLYGDQIDGVFTRPVEDAVLNYQLARGIRGDTLGVYGPATRASLEGETSDP